MPCSYLLSFPAAILRNHFLSSRFATLSWGWAATNKNSAERTIVIGHFPIYIKSSDEKETYSNLPPEKRERLLETFSKNNAGAYLSGHKHEVIINNFKGVQLVTGESTSKNFDKRPMGFRKWEVSADTLLHSFVALEAQQVAGSLQFLQSSQFCTTVLSRIISLYPFKARPITILCHGIHNMIHLWFHPLNQNHGN